MTREINFGGVHTFDTRAVHKIRVQMTLPLSRFFYGFFFLSPSRMHVVGYVACQREFVRPSLFSFFSFYQ